MIARLRKSPSLGEFGYSLLTVLLALIVGGLAMAFTGANPLNVYKDLIVGAGFDWPFHLIPGNPLGVEPLLAENNLVSTLVQFTPLVLTGFAVAFAFRCGLFNIGGTGQFWVGSVCALLVAQRVGGPSGMVLATLAAGVGGAIWAGLAGGLKAYRGAHEVITTIMLNWIAIYTTQYLFAVSGPLTDDSVGNGVSSNIKTSAQYPGMWGVVQQIHIGIFVALGCAVVYYVILNRTTLGYEVRAVGFNPEAARYGGISVKRSVIASMAICGAFAGLAGAIQVLGVSYSIASSDVPVIDIGFTGIAVALLGRNTAIGVVLAALLFAALQSGGRQLSGSFSPELAGGVSGIIQGTIILLVGGELIVRWLVARAKRERAELPPSSAGPLTARGGRSAGRNGTRMTRRTQIGWASFALFVVVILIWRTQSHAVAAIVSTGLFVGAFQYATPLTFGALGGLFSERSGVINIGLEGMMLMGCFWGVVVSQESGSWVIGLLGAMAAGGFLGLVHAFLSIHLRANQVISGTAVNILGLGITSYGTNAIFGSGGSGDVPRIPSVLHFLGHVPVIGDVIGGLNLMIYVAFVLVIVTWWFLFRTTWGLRLRAVGEHPRAADTVGIPVFRVRYLAVTFSGVLAGMGGAYLAFGLGSQFSENMTAGRGFIALAALIFGKWKPWGLLAAALLFGFSQALGDALQTIEHVNAFLVFNLPYVFTLVALVGVIGRSRGPAAAGLPYARQ